MDWETLVREDGPRVWQTAYRLLGNRADVEDCFQETFVAAMEVSRRQEVRCWSALLTRIATARSIDRIRQRKRRRAVESPAEPEHIADFQPGPVQEAVASELGESLRHALAELPPRQAEVFCLRFLNNLSYEQIAAQMTLSTDAVGVLLHRARARLKQLLTSVAHGK